MNKREVVQQALKNNNYFILRIFQVPGKSREQVAKEIVRMLAMDPNVNNKSVTQVLYSSDHYFVFFVPEVGIIACGAVSRDCEIKSIFVKPEFRRMGVASLLIKFLEDYARHELRCTKVCMKIKPKNSAMLKLAEKLGYRVRYVYVDKAVRRVEES